MDTAKGIMALIYTPLNRDFTLNEEAVRQEIDWVVENGALGIWPEGYAGEWPQLDMEMRQRHLEVCLDQARKHGKLFCAAGCHAGGTMQTIRLVNFAADLGYDCAWVSPPSPRKATQEEIIVHYEMILEQTALPIALYNCYPAGTYMNPALIAQLAAMDERIIAIKEIVGDICHIAGIYNEGVHKQLQVFGVEWNMLPHLIMGAAGTLVGSDWVPIAQALSRAFTDGNMERAWHLQRAILAQSPLLIPQAAALSMGASTAHSGIGYLKARFSLMSGIDMGPPMPPYKIASSDELRKAEKAVQQMEAILHV